MGKFLFGAFAVLVGPTPANAPAFGGICRAKYQVRAVTADSARPSTRCSLRAPNSTARLPLRHVETGLVPPPISALEVIVSIHFAYEPPGASIPASSKTISN